MSTTLKVLLIVVVAAVVVVVVLTGFGDRPPADPSCLPDLPRVDRHLVPAQPAPAADGRAWPLPEGSFTVSSPFGPREGGFHAGVDLAAAEGTSIFAAADGTVAAAGPASGFGNWIVIDSDGPDGLVSTVYGHMYEWGVGVQAGQRVTAGQQIGRVGAAGEATGAHLHFEVVPGGRLHGGHAIDPLPWLQTAHATPIPNAAGTFEKATHPRDTGPTKRAAQQRNSDTDTLAAHTSSRWSRQRSGIGCVTTPAHGGPASSAVGGGDTRLGAGSVPPDFEPWIRKAAATCPELSAPIVAAQLEQESGFNRTAVSPAGALGPAQFMPGTWTSQGIDGDGDGVTDPFSIADAVMSQGAFACKLIDLSKSGLTQGVLHGELTWLWLSMYNCGPEGTFAAGGVCQNPETQGYVTRIPELAAKYQAPEPAPNRLAFGPTR
ncbi:peptidoglycan DD-metalloendopeptidase family protein [Nocardia aurantia]|uniref:Peptidase n=1 Tax=Nocardia aurantia TaxID=2585199 RepID=A0A7K0DVR1_9NOCA|nr:peptidoglycan DD-metalloendopeptidase family protein [Nocardia aurantia]MQY28914.1 hypothetical protein [Nocardia aurantia]